MGCPAKDGDLEVQEHRLTTKFRSLVTPLLGYATTERLIEQVLQLDSLPSVRELTTLVGHRSDVAQKEPVSG
jgi:hypothetical protein